MSRGYQFTNNKEIGFQIYTKMKNEINQNEEREILLFSGKEKSSAVQRYIYIHSNLGPRAKQKLVLVE